MNIKLAYTLIIFLILSFSIDALAQTRRYPIGDAPSAGKILPKPKIGSSGTASNTISSSQLNGSKLSIDEIRGNNAIETQGSFGKSTQPKRFSNEKQDLVEMAKNDKKSGGITRNDMQAYKDLNKELSDPFPTKKVRGPESHPNRKHGKELHGHVGPINHIPIKDK